MKISRRETIFCQREKVLEKLSRTRFFTELENRALFSAATQQGKKGRILELRKNRVLESCFNISFPLVLAISTQKQNGLVKQTMQTIPYSCHFQQRKILGNV